MVVKVGLRATVSLHIMHNGVVDSHTGIWIKGEKDVNDVALG